MYDLQSMFTTPKSTVKKVQKDVKKFSEHIRSKDTIITENKTTKGKQSQHTIVKLSPPQTTPLQIHIPHTIDKKSLVHKYSTSIVFVHNSTGQTKETYTPWLNDCPILTKGHYSILNSI